MSLASPSSVASYPRGATDARTAIVTALGMVPGLVPTPTPPDVATEGAAWPRWRQTLYAGVLCDPSQHIFDVLVVLPAGYLEHTVDEGDRLRDLIAPALWQTARIDYAEPVAIQFNDSQTMPGLRLRVTTPR